MRIFLAQKRLFLAAWKSLVCECTLWRLNKKIGTFAFITVVVAGNGLFFEKIFDHRQDLPVIISVKIKCKVPRIIECYGLIWAFGADNSREKLAGKRIRDNGILPLFIVTPPFLALFRQIITICYKVCLFKSAVSYLYLGLEDRFNSWLISSRIPVKNSWASCWAYPWKRGFLAATAFFKSEGVYAGYLEALMDLTSLAYAPATLALYCISLAILSSRK